MSKKTAWIYQVAAMSRNRPVSVSEEHFSRPTIVQMAETIAKNLTDKSDVVACSMGGYIAFELYRLVPDKIRRLVLVNTSARAESTDAREARERAMTFARSKGVSALWDQAFASNFADPSKIPPQIRAGLYEDFFALGLPVFLSQCVAMMGRREAISILPTITCPTMIVVGERDMIVPPDRSIEISRGVAGSRLLKVSGAGHSLPLEFPDLFNAELYSFLDL